MTNIIEVTLNGEVKQLKFGNYALEKYTQLTGADIGTIKQLSDDYMQLDLVADIVYAGLFGYYRSTKKIVDFDIDQIKDWIDVMSYPDQLIVIKQFMTSVVIMTEQMADAMKAINAESMEGEKKN